MSNGTHKVIALIDDRAFASNVLCSLSICSNCPTILLGGATGNDRGRLDS